MTNTNAPCWPVTAVSSRPRRLLLLLRDFKIVAEFHASVLEKLGSEEAVRV